MMRLTIKATDIVRLARQQGACRLADGINDMLELSRMLFSPQGREFCIKHRFPSMGVWQKLSAHKQMRDWGIYINAGEVSINGGTNYCFVGETAAKCTFCGADDTRRILAMHGAKVEINLSDYAVCSICATDDCQIIINKDKTSIALHE